MESIHWRGFTLSRRIILFLVIFGITLLLSIFLWHYQSSHILEPTQRRTEVIQSISSFLNDTERCLDAMDEYRWDYGEPELLNGIKAGYQQSSVQQLAVFRGAPGEASEDYLLLLGAVETSYRYFSDRLDEICSLLLENRSGEASQVYYEKAELCGSYLRQYTRELLEQAILDYQDAFSELNATSDRLQLLQLITSLSSVAVTVLLVMSLYSLLRSVVQLSQASRRISQGELDIPDVDERRSDEIGHLAATFNEMKRSMKRQMQLLQEKNEMERTLRLRETETLALQNLIEAGKLQLLRSQIHPHFLFNTLNVIAYNARQEGAEKTGTLIASLSRLFRYSLGSNALEVPLSKEKQIVDDYFSFYHERFGDRLSLTWAIDPDIELTETMIPSFLIQPLVENAVQHGLGPKEEGGRVTIDVRKAESLLQITVSDDGVGMSQEALERLRAQLKSGTNSGEHIGLYNVAARLRLSGRAEGLEIRSGEGTGTAICMKLPLVIVSEEEDIEDE